MKTHLDHIAYRRLCLFQDGRNVVQACLSLDCNASLDEVSILVSRNLTRDENVSTSDDGLSLSQHSVSLFPQSGDCLIGTALGEAGGRGGAMVMCCGLEVQCNCGIQRTRESKRTWD